MQRAYQILITMALTASAVGLTGCLAGPGFLKQQGNASLVNDSSPVNASILSSQDGAITGAISGNSGDTQILSAADGSGIDGASVSFPPGSLAIDANITVEEGSDLASSAASELGLGSDLSAASGAVVVSASEDIAADTPFTIAITMDGAALVELDRSKIVVICKVKKPGEGYFIGIIPNSQLTFDGNKVSFATIHFGSFQAASTSAVITEKKEVATTTPIVTKREEIALPEPVNFKPVDADATSIRLTWTTGGGSTAGFALVFGLNQAPQTCSGATMTFSDPNKTEARVEKLLPARNYQFRLCALNAAGGQSAGVVTAGRTDDQVQNGLGAFGVAGGTPHLFLSAPQIPFTPSSGATEYVVKVGHNAGCTGTLAMGTVTIGASSPLLADVDSLDDGAYFLCLFAKRGTESRPAPAFHFEIETTQYQLSYSTNSAGLSAVRHFHAVNEFTTADNLVEGSLGSQDEISPVSSMVVKSNGDVSVVYGQKWNQTGANAPGYRFGVNLGTKAFAALGFTAASVANTVNFNLGEANAIALGLSESVHASVSSVNETSAPPFPGYAKHAYGAGLASVEQLVVPTASFSTTMTSLAYDSAGFGHEVLMTYTGSSPFLRYLKAANTTTFTGTPAVDLTGGSIGLMTSLCTTVITAQIAVDTNDRPHIAYLCSKVSIGTTCHIGVAHFNGSTWDLDNIEQVVCPPSNASFDVHAANANRVAIAIGSDNLAHMAWMNGALLKTKIINPNATTPTHTVASIGAGGFVSIGVDSSNHDYISYKGISLNDVRVVSNNSGVWPPENEHRLIGTGLGVTGVGNIVVGEWP